MIEECKKDLEELNVTLSKCKCGKILMWIWTSIFFSSPSWLPFRLWSKNDFAKFLPPLEWSLNVHKVELLKKLNCNFLHTWFCMPVKIQGTTLIENRIWWRRRIYLARKKVIVNKMRFQNAWGLEVLNLNVWGD